MSFQELHVQEKPLLICNVWDVASAKVAKELGFEAIATSSGAIASMLGYRDGEEMSFTELLYIVQRIVNCVNLPLSVDLEGGYSREPVQVAENILQLINLGVVGVNLEDSLVDQERHLLDAEAFATHLNAILIELGEKVKEIFINVRTDTFLLNCPNPIQETEKRGALYEQARADGLFVPCLQRPNDIEQIIGRIRLPLNIMCIPDLPSFNTLQKLGVKRISMGNSIFLRMLKYLESDLKRIL